MHTNLGVGMLLIDGQFVNAQVERVVLAIKDYEPELDVEWLPPGKRRDENGDPLPAFKIFHRPVGQPPLLLFTVKDESEFDLRVLWRIIRNDQRTQGKETYDDIRAMEEAQRLVAKQEQLDKMEEAADIVAHVLKSHLNKYVVSPDLVIKEGIPFNAANLKD